MECERADPDHPLRQGDIVAAQPGTDSWKNPWTRFGVVLTADCDLAHGKSGPNLVYVPILDHHAYIADVWLPGEAEDLARAGRDKVEKQLASLQSKLGFRHIAAWGEAGGENIASKLTEQLGSLKSGIDTERISADIILMWHATTELQVLSKRPQPTQATQLRDLLSRLVQHGSAISQNKFGDPNSCRRFLETALCSLQDRVDISLIRELIGLDTDMLDSPCFGYVVPLRSFSLLQVEKIDTDRNHWYGNRDHYLRICRLRGPYKFDLVQRFANLFVRVGLEDYRLVEHRRAFKRCAESLFPEGSKDPL
jgi:hypothetical protein